MNEIRDLIIGIDFGEKTSQICYYDRKAGEPRSVSMKIGSEEFEAPTCICKRTEQNDYTIGLEAVYFAREKGGIAIDNLYQVCQKEENVRIAGEEKAPWELLAVFFKGLLKFLGIADIVKNTCCLVVTSPAFNAVQVRNVEKACESIGFEERQYMMMDYGESFYYYALTQKRETWNRSVGWYAFEEKQVVFRKMSLNGGTRPILVKLEDPRFMEFPQMEGQEQDSGVYEKELDQAFYSFIQETLGNELYSSIQITGKGFDPRWAKKSVAHLCMQKRKVFYGNNLFAKGACAAGKEKKEDKNLKGYRYMSPALVLKDVGMDMRVMGAPAYYPLIEAGKNWYECKAQCEMILDDTSDLIFVVGTYGEKQKKKVVMSLPGLPQRPNKTTRLSLSLSYTSQEKCEVVVKDLGFGDMFPSSGKVWTELVKW